MQPTRKLIAFDIKLLGGIVVWAMRRRYRPSARQTCISGVGRRLFVNEEVAVRRPALFFCFVFSSSSLLTSPISLFSCPVPQLPFLFISPGEIGQKNQTRESSGNEHKEIQNLRHKLVHISVPKSILQQQSVSCH